MNQCEIIAKEKWQNDQAKDPSADANCEKCGQNHGQTLNKIANIQWENGIRHLNILSKTVQKSTNRSGIEKSHWSLHNSEEHWGMQIPGAEQ